MIQTARAAGSAGIAPASNPTAVVHALVIDGVIEHGGAFLALTAPDLAALEELFRRLVLAALVKAQRLSEGFRDSLLTSHHSGFSVYGAQVVLPEETGRIAHLARGSFSDAIVAGCDP